MIDSERSFPATLQGLSEASDFLAGLLTADECPQKAKSALMIALDEVASNIVHYSGAPDFTLALDASEDSPYVKMIFSDAGAPYDPLLKMDPDVTLAADDRPVGGLGIFMVKRLMDEIAYSRTDGRNVLTLKKKRL